MRQTACLVINTITVDSYGVLLIARRQFGPQTQRWTMHELGFYVPSTVFQSFRDEAMDRRETSISGLGPDAMSLAWPDVVQSVVLFSSRWQ